jgi:hypothetical protein
MTFWQKIKFLSSKSMGAKITTILPKEKIQWQFLMVHQAEID